MAASELSELRAELWRTRDDLERMKSRGTPPSTNRSPRRDRRHHASISPNPAAAARDRRKMGRTIRRYRHNEQIVLGKGNDLEGSGEGRVAAGGGIRSGPTSPPTSGDSSPASGTGDNNEARRGLGKRLGSGGGVGASASPARRQKSGSSRDVLSTSSGEETARGSSEEVAAEETLCNLELEGAAFKNWTEEASSIAVRLIEEVKMLRWEKAGWADRERAAERAAVEARERADRLEERLQSVEADGRRSQEALARAEQDAERERARAKAERAKAERLRAAAAAAAQQETERKQQQQQLQQEKQLKEAVGGGGAGEGLMEMLRREREGTDALQRRLDAARAASARHERERKEWRSSRARLEELRRSWGKQLKKVEKKMISMAKENAALRARVGEAERARDRADADSLRHRDELRRLTEQRDNLLLGATRLGGRRGGLLSASSPTDALAELLAAAAAGVAADAVAGDSGAGVFGNSVGVRAPAEQEELEAQLEQARSEAKLARVAAQQERLKREGAAREKEEAVRQLHRLMGAARRAVGRRDSRLRSSRLETEVVWNALTEAVR